MFEVKQWPGKSLSYFFVVIVAVVVVVVIVVVVVVKIRLRFERGEKLIENDNVGIYFLIWQKAQSNH